MLKIILHEKFISTVLILVSLFVIYFLIKNIIDKLLNFKTKNIHIDVKRVNTIKILFTNICKYVLIFIGIIVFLNALGIDTTSLLAGLGVVGVVVGLSLQDILKDFFAGIFFIIENQFQVGDTIEIGDFKGEVISLGLKTTRIKKYTGEIKIISNRNIDYIINYSKANSLELIDVGVAYEEDSDKVLEILNKLCERLSSEIKDLKGEIKPLGIEQLDDSSVVYRISVVTKPMKQYDVKRKILLEIKKEFEKQNIKIPYPQVEVHNGTKI